MSNLPVKKDESFFGKIKDFFKKILGSKSEKVEIKEERKLDENATTLKDSLKETVNTEKEQIASMDMDSYLEQFERNSELLNELSLDRLEKLSEHYDNVIADLKSKVNGSANIVSNMNKEAFLEEIEKNPELLNELSIERLEKLSDYYDELIEDLKKKLAA